MSTLIYTIGHSTHAWDTFIKILQNYTIGLLVDVRSIPRSRHNPQFNKDVLDPGLGKHDIRYIHLKELGGLRHTTGDSINTGWTNLSFRGFADHMQTEEFQRGIDQLIEAAHLARAVIMCAEALPWRCHRSLIADALVIRDVTVEHIMGAHSTRVHAVNPGAKVIGTAITYPASSMSGKLDL
jgi:uncharacterized protein (DUF488 family)